MFIAASVMQGQPGKLTRTTFPVDHEFSCVVMSTKHVQSDIAPTTSREAGYDLLLWANSSSNHIQAATSHCPNYPQGSMLSGQQQQQQVNAAKPHLEPLDTTCPHIAWHNGSQLQMQKRAAHKSSVNSLQMFTQ